MDTGDLNVLSKLSAQVVDTVNQNIVLNAFRIAVNGSLTQFSMVDGIVDEYEDESGIDTGASVDQSYDSVNDLYSPLKDTISVSPFAHYKCNDNTANTLVTDNGTGANDGAGNIDTSNYSVSGKINQAFDLNGSSEFIILDALEVDIDSDTTGSISVWINPDSLTGSQTIFTMADTSEEIYFTLNLNNDKIQCGYINLDSPGLRWLLRDDTTTLSTGTWYHIVIVQDGSSPKMYVNSVDVTNLVTSNDATLWFSANESDFDNARLGTLFRNNNAPTFFMNGQIDDFRYYKNIVLTQSDIDLLYNSGTGTEDTNPEGSPNNMTLISQEFTAEAEADTARINIYQEDVDSITLNTDLIASVSRDNGVTFSTITLVNEGEYESGRNILSASVDISGQPAGTEMIYKIETANNKDLKIHGTGLSWD